MPEKEPVSKETEIALVGHEVKELNKKVDELKTTFKSMVDDIHGHITREYNLVSRENENKLRLAIIESERSVTEATDKKIAESTGAVKTTVWTWATILIGTVILSFGSFIFITSQKEPVRIEGNKITIEQATKFIETAIREVTKSNKAYLKGTNLKSTKTETESIE